MQPQPPRQRVNPRSVTAVVSGEGESAIHLKTVISQDALTTEAAELRRAGQVCRQLTSIYVPEVLSVDSQSHTLAMSHIAGESLFNYLWNSTSLMTTRPLTSAAAESIASTVGEWLRVYHESSRADGVINSQEASELVASGIRKIARVAESRQGFLSREEGAAISRYLQNCRDALEVTKGHVRVHGDFAPQNMLIDNSYKVCVLDFGDARVGLPAADYVRFWQELWATGQLGRRRHRAVSVMLSAFTEAYAGIGLHAAQFEFFRCWNAVCFLSSYVFSNHLIGFTGRWVAWRLACIHANWLKSVVVGSLAAR